MKRLSLWNLYLIFFKIGAILLGGGYVILPILTNEFVDKRGLIKYDSILNYFTLSQSLPGIIAANVSIFIGYELRGFLGALFAIFGIISAPFLAIIILATFLEYLTGNSYVQSALGGVGIAVVALILLTAREIWQKTKKDAYFYMLFILSLIALLFFKLSPINTIILFVFLGLFYKIIFTQKEDK